MAAGNPVAEKEKLRLGYACLNTVLRAQDPSVFCSRTCRLATVRESGIEHAHKLALQNARDIIPMLRWNEAHHIRFMRLSSEMLPFASHAEVGYRVADVPGLVEAFKEVGEVAKALGHRLTMHPGQFCQLASPREVVFDAAIRDLEFHADILEMIGLGPDSVMIIHMGGVYNDKEATLARFIERWPRVPPRIQSRIVLENDDVSYSVHDLLPISEQLQIPLVLDWHHANIITSPEPSESYLPRINAVWHARGIRPKQHYSEPRSTAVTPHEMRAHSKRVEALPPCAPGTDLMIEAKDKEQAVMHLYRRFQLEEVADEYPVTPERQEELAKLAKRAPKKPKKVKPEAEGDDDGDDAPLAPVKRVRARRVKKEVVSANVKDESGGEEPEEDEQEEEEEVMPKPKRRRVVKHEASAAASIGTAPPLALKRTRATKAVKVVVKSEEVGEEVVVPKPKRGRPAKAKPSAAAIISDDAQSTIRNTQPAPAKAKRGRQPKTKMPPSVPIDNDVPPPPAQKGKARLAKTAPPVVENAAPDAASPPPPAKKRARTTKNSQPAVER
ncbi:hypothetical protein HDU89_005486 [Geranomyces variabilis]|nr:hypothetical protein HDU89_005486 [Geranomyces variabilis]